jgi:HAD superfamily hydrolase (TIGR01509 family)
LIDIGDVVVWDPRPTIVRQLLQRASVDPLRFRRSYYGVARRMAAGTIGLREAYVTLRRQFRWSVSYAEFREVVGPRSLDAIPGALRALGTLHRRGTVRIVYASNIEPVTWEGLCRKFRLDGYADGAALSFRLRSLKPSARFFRGALRVARASPSEILYLDDLPENIRAAQALGIPSRRVRSAHDTLEVLRKLSSRPARRDRPAGQSM